MKQQFKYGLVSARFRSGIPFFLRIMRILTIMLAVFVASIVVSGIALYILAGTPLLNRWLAGLLQPILQEQLVGSIEIGAVRVDIFKGIELDSVRLLAAGDTLFAAPRVEVHYTPEALLYRTIAISKLRILQPRIKLLRATDSTWNFEHLFKPTPKPSQRPPALILYARSIEIDEGDLTINDSLSMPDTTGSFDPLHSQLDSVTLRASLLAYLRDERYNIAIDRLSWTQGDKHDVMTHVRGIIEFDSVRTSIPRLQFTIGSSQLLLANSSIASDSMMSYHGHLTAHITPAETKRFLPPSLRIGTPCFIDAQLSGTSSQLDVTQVLIRARSSTISGSAQVGNLDGRGISKWSMEAQSTLLHWDDIHCLMPQLSLPNLPLLQNLSLAKLTARGIGDSLDASIVAHTQAGTLNSSLSLNLSTPARYRILGTIGRLDLAQVDSTFPSTWLNLRFDLEGQGFSLTETVATATLMLDSSSVGSTSIDHAFTTVRLDRGIMELDTLNIDLVDPNGYEQPVIGMRGSIQITPPYTTAFFLTFQHVPLDHLFHSNMLPELLSGTASVASQGISLDDVRAKVMLDVTECILQDRSLLPFRMEIELGVRDNIRLLAIHSAQFEAAVIGRFTIPALADAITQHVSYIDMLVKQNIALLQGISAPDFPDHRFESADTIAISFHINVNSLALLSPFLVPTTLEASGIIAGQFRTTGRESSIVLDTLTLRRTVWSIPGGFYLASMPLHASFQIAFDQHSHQPRVQSAAFEFAVDSVLRLDDTRIVNPSLQGRWDGSTLTLRTPHVAWIDNTMPLFFEATLTELAPSYHQLIITALRAGLSPEFVWKALQPININLHNGRYTITQALLGLESETAQLDMSGTVSVSAINNGQIHLTRMNLHSLTHIRQLATIDALEGVEGMLDSLVLVIDGPLQNPQCTSTGKLSKLAYGGVDIGSAEYTVSYGEDNLTGGVSIYTQAGHTVLDARVERLPLRLSVSPFQLTIKSNEELAIKLLAHKLSLAIVEPFMGGISQLRGTGDAVLSIDGSLPDKVRFSGNVQYEHCEFLVPSTNIRYSSRGRITLDNTVLRLDTIELFNDPADLLRGRALLTGTIAFRGFQPDKLDIRIEIPAKPGLLVMSNATAAVNTTMYGRVVISSEEDSRLRSLHLTGSFQSPRLNGFVRLEEADITFPPTTAVTVQTSSFSYRKAGHGYVFTDAISNEQNDTTFGELPPRNSLQQSPKAWQLKPGFSELLLTEVDVKIRRQIRIKMDFSSVEQLVAFVEQENPADYLSFIRQGSRSSQLLGSLILSPSSTYKFYSNFAASGQLRFTTGEIDNPEINLRAMYVGERTIGSDNRREPYSIMIQITGTKRKPRVQMTYEINGEEAPGARGDSTRIMTNALLLLLFGRTQDELTGSAGAGATAALDQSLNAARSAAISAFLTNALQGGVIKNVNIDFGSSDVTSLAQARIMLTGQLFGANVTIGGSVADLTQNSQITLDLSLGNVLGIEWLRNLITQFQATANPGQSLSRQQKQWELRVGWRVP